MFPTLKLRMLIQNHLEVGFNFHQNRRTFLRRDFQAQVVTYNNYRVTFDKKSKTLVNFILDGNSGRGLCRKVSINYLAQFAVKGINFTLRELSFGKEATVEIFKCVNVI